jgi:hypothetical protein
VRRKTRSDPIQFRLALDDYAVLERIADAEGFDTPKDLVLALTMDAISEERARETIAS